MMMSKRKKKGWEEEREEKENVWGRETTKGYWREKKKLERTVGV
jgi:hypothetical protein